MTDDPRHTAPAVTAGGGVRAGAVIGKTLAIGVIAVIIAVLAYFPFAPWVLGIGLVVYAGLLLRFPRLWIFCLPIALPLLDLTLWSGWFFFNAADLTALTTLAVVFWRAECGIVPLNPIRWPEALILLMALSFLISMLIGLAPLPPITVNAFAHYVSPYNALRVAKGFFWAWLLYLPLKRAMTADPDGTRELLLAGMSTALIGVGLVVVWERGVLLAIVEWKNIYAVVGSLLDFSTHYRATGPFSSMHTGGATLDGFVAIALPFALGAVFLTRFRRVRLLGLAALGLGLYALAMTFSRGTYLAGGIGLLVFFVGLFFCWNHYLHIRGRTILIGIGLVAVFGTLMAVGFARGGMIMVALGAVLVLGAGSIGYLLRERPLVLLLVVCAALAGGTYLVAFDSLVESRWHAQSPETAMIFAVFFAAVMAFVPGLAARRLVRPATARLTFLLFLVILILGAGAIPSLGGYRIGVRFERVSADLDIRYAHWRDTLAMVSPDVLHNVFGMGTGSFPRAFFWNNLDAEGLASYEYAREDGRTFLRMGAALFEIMQKISIRPHQEYQVSITFRGHSRHRSQVTVKTCHKHILYSERYVPNCVTHKVTNADIDTWETHNYAFNSNTLGASGPFYWPVTVMLFNGSAEENVEISHFEIIAPDGRNLISNGDFADGGDRWIFVADFHHLPWHAKNIFLHVLFEQGWFGLIVVFGAYLVAFGRLAPLIAGGNELAVVLVAAMVGYLMVGLFGSLIDSPRLATLAFLVLFLGLIPNQNSPVREPPH